MTPPAEEKAMDHDAAIDAIVGCAQTVTVLSYQEAIEGYLKLRGMWPPLHAAIPDGEVDEIRERQIERWTAINESDQTPPQSYIDIDTLLARLTALEAENAALKAEVVEARAKAIEEYGRMLRFLERGIRELPAQPTADGAAWVGELMPMLQHIRSLSSQGE